MSIHLSKTDKEKIKEAIVEAELKTSGEIVPVIVPSSDMYGAARWRIAFTTAIMLTYVFYYFFDELAFYQYMLLELLFLYIGFQLSLIPQLFRLAITKKELDEEVYQRALEAFHAHKLPNTKDRTGILIFISLLERKVFILADQGISSKLPQETWDNVINEMLQIIKGKKLSSAIIYAIENCGRLLAQHFPIKPDDKNELPNEVIIDK